MTCSCTPSVLVGILLSVGASTGVFAQTQALETNWPVVGWFSNKPTGTLKPSGGEVPYPQDADANPVEYDTRLILPSTITIHGLTPPPSGLNTPTLLYFSGLPNPDTSPNPSYLAYPFKTGPQNDADILINQATYSLDDLNYGQDFNVTATLYDATTQQEYPLSKNVKFSEVYDPNWQGFQFINNQQWPMSPSAPHFAADAYKFPVPLKPNHDYELRTYLAKNSTSSSGFGMMDDMVIYIQAVKAEANDDPNVDLPAATGGSTPTSVVTNDKLANVLVNPAASNYVVTPVGTLPAGVTLLPNGVIQVAPAQPQTYTIPYQLCPNYGPTLFGASFQSNACKTATAQVTLVGTPLPPTVSITCSPAIPDSVGPAAVCTVKADTVVTNPLTVRLAPPTSNGRYQTDCSTSIQIPGGADQATCNITAVPNNIPGDGNVTATITLEADAAYVIGTGSASVTVQDDDLSIVGSVQGAPAAFPPALVGQTVNYSLTCAPGTATPVSGQLTIGANGQLSAPSTHVDPGTVCTGMTVDGIGQLPAAPAGYTWTSAVATTGASNAFVVTLVMAPGNPPVTTPVPTLQAWGLALLSLLVVGWGLLLQRRNKA